MYLLSRAKNPKLSQVKLTQSFSVYTRCEFRSVSLSCYNLDSNKNLC